MKTKLTGISAVTAAALAGCFSICQPKLESAVDAPVTVAAAQALASPPDVTVTVERIVKHEGGGGCGHSPLCVIVLPILLWDAMFPEKYDEVVVVDHGKETYRASFAVDGDFLQARVTKDGTVRDLRQLKLAKLGKRVVVEVARGATADSVAPVPIVPQVDLVADYQKAIAGASARDAGELDVEALTWLDKEALALVQPRMRDPKVDDAEKERVVDALCGAGALSEMSRSIVDDIARAPVGTKTAEAALIKCAVPSSGEPKLDAAQAQAFTDAYVASLCTRGSDARAMDFRGFVTHGTPPWIASAKAASARCKDPGAAAFFALAFGDDVDDQALEAVRTGPWAQDILADRKVLAHTAFINAALDDDELAPTAVDTVLASVDHGALAPNLRAPLARRYARGVHAMFCTGYEREAEIIAVLAGLPPAARAEAQQALQAARTDARGGIVDAGLVALGADVDGAALRKTLAFTTRKKGSGTCDDAGVAKAALDVAGCTSADIAKPRVHCAKPRAQ